MVRQLKREWKGRVLADGRRVAYVYGQSVEIMRDRKKLVENVLQSSTGLCDTKNHEFYGKFWLVAIFLLIFGGLCWAAGRYWT